MEIDFLKTLEEKIEAIIFGRKYIFDDEMRYHLTSTVKRDKTSKITPD
jgi:hypothetical protein